MIEHIQKTIYTNEDAREMYHNFKTMLPLISAMDTETTGLHIINDVPFLFQFGWLSRSEQLIYTYAVDLEKQPLLGHQVIQAFRELSGDCHRLLGHNIKYDLHMLANFGEPFEQDNLSDTTFYIRFAHDALTVANGGPPMGLKEYSARYIDRRAADHERLLKLEQSQIAKELNLKLQARLGKPWTAGKLEEFFKDTLNSAEDLSTNDREAYNQWLREDVPAIMRSRITGRVSGEDVPYSLLNRNNVITYGHKDIYLTLLTYLTTRDVVYEHQNGKALRTEEALILPLFEMERVGFDTDVAYLETSRVKMKNYILQRRQDFCNMAGCELKVGQHQRIKEIALEKFNVIFESTRDDIIEHYLSEVDPEHPIVPWLQCLQELRTLEKWYSVYIIRFLRTVDANCKLYTTINQVGTVTGRVTSDFQQFPKKGITTKDGETLFNPREMVHVPQNSEYDGIVYLDYSQIELRLQAMYTLLIQHPEPNLYRAYGPLFCYHKERGLFDPTNIEHIRAWEEDWYLDSEYTQKWTPQDVHAATTCYAFNITPDDPKFKELRSIGKTINFAKNYGAQRKRIRQMFPKATDAEVDRINEAYYKAFPGVKEYHNYCYRLADYQSYATNLFGTRYYGVSGHNLINMLIQGSGASLLKWKIREVYDYCKANKIKSRLQMNIHDELSWLKHKDELDVFFKFKQIMETWEDTQIPIVAEMDATRTTWAAKKGIDNVEELNKLYAD